MSLRVSILEDERMLAEALHGALQEAGVSVVGTHTNPTAFISEVRATVPDVVIVDLRLEDSRDPQVVRDGTDVLDALRRVAPTVRTVVLSAKQDAATIERCRELGASAFLSKQSARPSLVVDTLKRVGAGERHFPLTSLSMIHHHRPTPRGPLDALTARELETLRYVVGGADNAQIAAHLGVAERTVKAHLAAMYRKLQCANRTQLALKAHELGVTPVAR